jgi:preprotein translocase subunit YajC
MKKNLGVDTQKSAKNPIKFGDKVVVIDGEYKGYYGTVSDVSQDDFITIDIYDDKNGLKVTFSNNILRRVGKFPGEWK